MTHTPKWMYEQFCNTFPQFCLGEEITYYPNGNNAIKIEYSCAIFPSLIFVYHNKRDWKLITECLYNEEEKAVQKLREELSIEQKKAYNIRRSERRNNK